MPRKKNGHDFSKYNSQPRVSLRKDVARFLAYGREHAPGVFFTYPEVVQRVAGYKSRPSIKSKEVEAVRGTIGEVRRILMEEHGCGVITDPLAGVRATVDDADLLSSQMVKSATRLRSAQDMFVRTSQLVDVNKVPNTAELTPLKNWFKGAVTSVVKSIGSTDFAAKLLPPKRDAE